MGRSAIEFTNARNEADGNVYAGQLWGCFLRAVSCASSSPEPPEWHDLELVARGARLGQERHDGRDHAALDADKLELTLSVKGNLAPLEIYKGIDTDFFGHASTGTRLPGPFADLDGGFKARSVDPRR